MNFETGVMTANNPMASKNSGLWGKVAGLFAISVLAFVTYPQTASAEDARQRGRRRDACASA